MSLKNENRISLNLTILYIICYCRPMSPNGLNVSKQKKSSNNAVFTVPQQNAREILVSSQEKVRRIPHTENRILNPTFLSNIRIVRKPNFRKNVITQYTKLFRLESYNK